VTAVAVPHTGRRLGPLVWFILGVVYVVWGSTYLGIKLVIETMPPLTSMGARFVTAAGVLAVIVAARRGPRVLAVTPRQLIATTAVGALLLGFGLGGVTLAERTVPSGMAALIVAAMPLWVVLLRRGAGQRVPVTTYAGVALGVAGVAVLVLPGRATAGGDLLGYLIILAGTVSWAFGSFISPRLPLPTDPIVLAVYEMLCGGLVLIAVGVASGELADPGRIIAGISLRSLLGWGYLVTVGSMVGFTAFVWLLDNAPISTVATYAYVNPVVAVGLGTAFAGEPFSAAIAAGGAIVVLGVALVVRSPAP
jgi:drug/metabolite transporter (DMT)-like permease